MTEFIAHNLAPIMFLTLVVVLLLGYPVAFSLAAVGLGFFVIGVELAPLSNDINLFWPLLGALPDRFFDGVMSNDTLLAIPLLLLMSAILAFILLGEGKTAFDSLSKAGYRRLLIMALAIAAAFLAVEYLIASNLWLLLDGPAFDNVTWATAAHGTGLVLALFVMSRQFKPSSAVATTAPTPSVIMVAAAIVLAVAAASASDVMRTAEALAFGAAAALTMAIARQSHIRPLIRQSVRMSASVSASLIFVLIGLRTFSLAFFGVNGHLWIEELTAKLSAPVAVSSLQRRQGVELASFSSTSIDRASAARPETLATIAGTVGARR
ncbi:TRAP dicarboxylate transporter subunit DctM [Aurantimonas sp. 22II-16-19i]|nr:TRAP transporter large permease subunit [Aurantimonas sp. 22II-16-19i]ORE93769.1 TRAP dicarboxylate transporter subunit DctM [Aurantimonas sp. 22II-16-19i]